MVRFWLPSVGLGNLQGGSSDEAWFDRGAALGTDVCGCTGRTGGGFAAAGAGDLGQRDGRVADRARSCLYSDWGAVAGENGGIGGFGECAPTEGGARYAACVGIAGRSTDDDELQRVPGDSV